ncbi:hypothetical protein JOJ88_005915 [Pantoea cypripedii]|nr:hypothetical protein [Pantoea cypripedii]
MQVFMRIYTTNNGRSSGINIFIIHGWSPVRTT